MQRKIPHNIHDQTFYALMSDQDFAVGFYRTYLPEDVLALIDFNTLEIMNVSGRTIGDDDHEASQVDVVHSIKLGNNKNHLNTKKRTIGLSRKDEMRLGCGEKDNIQGESE